MNIIGLDFGTTNSTISFYNVESQVLDSFRLDASASDYIPSVITYNKHKETDISIGNAAKLSLTSKNTETYENFKLRLCGNFNNANEIIEGKTKTPLQVTHDFLKHLFSAYRNKQRINTIDFVTMTIPEAWLHSQSARENIEKIFNKLGFDDFQFQLESEPVAAAAYFCHAYEQKNTSKYHGFILVIDFGGGTLDVTLCESTDGSTVKVLERRGFGEYGQTNGCAGVAFDEAVMEKLIKDNNLPIQKNSPQFIKLRSRFENRKTAEIDKIAENLKHYYYDPMIIEGEILFTLQYNDDGDEINISCEDLAHCFELINAPVLKEALNDVSQFFSTHGVNSAVQDNFRVLLVGGFSNFYAVEEEARRFFGSKTGFVDKRFEQPFSITNRALAISRGAALIAQKAIEVEHVYPHHTGYTVVYRDAQDKWTEKDILVAEKGVNATKAIYSTESVRFLRPSGEVKIFLNYRRDDNTGRKILIISLNQLFSHFDYNESYKIGFSINKNRTLLLHLKDKSGNEIQSVIIKE